MIRDDCTVAPLALLEVQDCLQEMVSSKIGPERFRDVNLRIVQPVKRDDAPPPEKVERTPPPEPEREPPKKTHKVDIKV